jgi:flagellar biogenesis protein FliO
MFAGYEFVFIALFIAAVAGLTWLMKRAQWNPSIRLARKDAARRELEALGRLALGQNQTLTLVRVRQQEYLVACGPGCVTIQCVSSVHAADGLRESAA